MWKTVWKIPWSHDTSKWLKTIPKWKWKVLPNRPMNEFNLSVFPKRKNYMIQAKTMPNYFYEEHLRSKQIHAISLENASCFLKYKIVFKRRLKPTSNVSHTTSIKAKKEFADLVIQGLAKLPSDVSIRTEEHYAACWTQVFVKNALKKIDFNGIQRSDSRQRKAGLDTNESWAPVLHLSYCKEKTHFSKK